jgi:hypothetical protein
LLTTIRILKVPPGTEFEGFNLHRYLFQPGEVAQVPRRLAEALIAADFAEPEMRKAQRRSERQ